MPVPDASVSPGSYNWIISMLHATFVLPVWLSAVNHQYTEHVAMIKN